MGLFEIFFPEQAEAEHLKRIADGISAQNRRSAGSGKNTATAIDDCRNDVEFLALIVFAMLKKLNEQDVISKDDLLETLKEIDLMDGKADGKIDLKILQGALGLTRSKNSSGRKRRPR